jgi:hypothetical protein
LARAVAARVYTIATMELGLGHVGSGAFLDPGEGRRWWIGRGYAGTCRAGRCAWGLTARCDDPTSKHNSAAGPNQLDVEINVPLFVYYVSLDQFLSARSCSHQIGR